MSIHVTVGGEGSAALNIYILYVFINIFVRKHFIIPFLHNPVAKHVVSQHTAKTTYNMLELTYFSIFI